MIVEPVSATVEPWSSTPFARNLEIQFNCFFVCGQNLNGLALAMSIAGIAGSFAPNHCGGHFERDIHMLG